MRPNAQRESLPWVRHRAWGPGKSQRLGSTTGLRGPAGVSAWGLLHGTRSQQDLAPGVRHGAWGPGWSRHLGSTAVSGASL